MRIVAVSSRYPPWSIGGYETMAAGAVAELRRRGHHVRVLSTLPDPSDRTAENPSDPDMHRELGWYWRDHAFPAIGLRATVARERANHAVLAGHLRREDPDAVLWWAMGGMSLSLLEHVRRAAVPAVGVVGDDWLIYGPLVDAWTRRFRGWRSVAAPGVERLTKLPARVDLGSAARWVFISEHVRASARTAGLQIPDSVVAYPGVDGERFSPHSPGPWRWRLLYCGRIDERKGIATAIEALGELPAQVTLTIDGDGDHAHAGELRALADRLELGERVRFQCSSPGDLAQVYADADAVVFPVRWEEPWGLVPLEAMAVGRPVIASRAGGGAAEYLADGENCLQFPPGDARALADALRRLAAAPELRADLLEGGRRTARRFAASSFNETLEQELEQAAAGA